MFKKLLVLILCILIISFGNVFASETSDQKEAAIKAAEIAKQTQINKAETTFTTDKAELDKKYDNDTKSLEGQDKLNYHIELDKLNASHADGIGIEANNAYNNELIDKGTFKQKKNGAEGILKDASKAEKKACASGTLANCKEAKEDLEKAEKDFKEAKDEYDDSTTAEGDITSRGYQINVDYISPGMGITGGTTKENVNYLLATIIQNLMIALGSLALLIMTVGAGYIVLHNGQDELLSKGKSIFMSGVYALIVALSAYYLINIIRFILFQGS